MTINALDKFNIINAYFQKESSLTAIATQYNLNVRTLQRWIKEYNKNGLQGLEKKRRADLGKHRKITVQIKELIEGLQLQKGKSTVATITRIINKYCMEQNLLPINYHGVRKIISRIPKDLNVLAKYGNKAYENSYEVIMRRVSKAPNEIWQVDHSMLSIKVLVDDKKQDNPWLTIIIDDYSRAIMSFCLFIGAPSAMQTALALRNAIGDAPRVGPK